MIDRRITASCLIGFDVGIQSECNPTVRDPQAAEDRDGACRTMTERLAKTKA